MGFQNELDETVKAIKKDRDVLAVMLFGSAARNQTTTMSDIDICIFLKSDIKDKHKMAEKRLEYLINAPDKFDIQIFQLLPLYIRVRVLKEGKILYCRNIKQLYDIAMKTMKEYAVFEPHYQTYLAEVSYVR